MTAEMNNVWGMSKEITLNIGIADCPLLFDIKHVTVSKWVRRINWTIEHYARQPTKSAPQRRQLWLSVRGC